VPLRAVEEQALLRWQPQACGFPGPLSHARATDAQTGDRAEGLLSGLTAKWQLRRPIAVIRSSRRSL